MKNIKAQTLIEYALVFTIVVVALTAMKVYLQRGVQGVIKISADQIGYQKDGLYEKDLKKGYITNSNIKRYNDNIKIIKFGQSQWGESPGSTYIESFEKTVQTGTAFNQNKIEYNEE